MATESTVLTHLASVRQHHVFTGQHHVCQNLGFGGRAASHGTERHVFVQQLPTQPSALGMMLVRHPCAGSRGIATS